MLRYVTAARYEPEARVTELVDYLLSQAAPVNATTGQIRAIARLFQHQRLIMKDLADGTEVDARELVDAATAELAEAGAGTVGALALQSLINGLLVGAARVDEVRVS